MIEEGADEKLQREVEEQLKFAELERMMMQEEQEAGDLQVIFLQNIIFSLQGLFLISVYCGVQVKIHLCFISQKPLQK